MEPGALILEKKATLRVFPDGTEIKFFLGHIYIGVRIACCKIKSYNSNATYATAEKSYFLVLICLRGD